MTSQRNRRVGDDVLLDAARECVLDVGFRRTTLTDVARRAKVSRMTVYRRFADVRSLVADLMTREFGELLAKTTVSAADAPTERERLVGGAIASARELWANPLLIRLLDLDPELLLPYLVAQAGATQRMVEESLLHSVQAGQADGSIRAGEPKLISRGVYLVMQSFVLSVRPAMTELGEPSVARGKLIDELAHVLDGSLRPVSPP